VLLTLYPEDRIFREWWSFADKLIAGAMTSA